MKTAAKTVLVPIADGSEEIEAVCIIDTLRRAGADVTVAAVGAQTLVNASRGIKLVADKTMEACAGKTYDLIALPGGMPGSAHLRDSQPLADMLREQHRKGQLYAAICAAPVVVLQHHGLLENKRATAHPALVNDLRNKESAHERVVVDGSCVTSRGPGTALEFALKLVELLYDADKARTLSSEMVARTGA